MAFDDSPQKQQPAKGKGKGAESDDVDYYEQDPGVLTDAHTDATSEDEEMRIQSLNIVQGEVNELQQATIEAIEAKEKKNRIRREKRAQAKFLRAENMHLALQHAAKASAANQEMIDRLTSSHPNGLGSHNPLAGPGSTLSAPQVPQQLSSAALYTPASTTMAQPPRGTTFPLAPVPAPPPARATLPVLQEDVTKFRDPLCSLCKTRHGVNICPAVQTLDDLKVLRVKLLNSNDPSEDKVRVDPKITIDLFIVSTDVRSSVPG
jgi:hypothetical protein